MYNYNYMDELYHHGITGQKWGSRNGPPYPLKKGVSSQIKKGNNPKFKQDEEYRKEREKLKSGEDVETVGKSLFRKKKKKNIFNKKKKVSDLPQEYKNVQMVQEILEDEDSKYFDSRRFGSKNLKDLTTRFRDEADYNDALSKRYENEAKMIDSHKKLMSRKEQKKYEKMMRKMELDTAYNEMIQKQIQSQINLIQSKQTLKQLTTKPPKPKKEGIVKRGAEFMGNLGKDMLKQGLYVAGTQASSIVAAELMNSAFRNYYYHSNAHKNPEKGDLPNAYINPKEKPQGGKKKNN